MQKISDISSIIQEADCIVSHREVEAAIDRVAAEMTQRLSQTNPVLLCLMKGGLVFTGKLIERLQFPLEIDYIHATRYQNETVGTDQIEWLALPKTDLSNRTVILVDDILDVGFTLNAVLASSQLSKAKEIFTAVLVDKVHDRKANPNFKAHYTGLTVEDRYLFGYGMDYKGYLRNAQGIYAIKHL